jgi:gliding motility-associated-like protein
MHAFAGAQVCNGSLGDPVVNVNFGAGANPGLPLQSATTSYNFITTSCPDDGNYTVVNNTSGCFMNSWHTISEDHTPNDVNGYMMLVNATYTPGDFYVDTVKGLCANTTYEFAAWIVNVLGATSCTPTPILPKLVFNIETISGVVLGTYSTGDIPGSPSPAWKQYGLFFTTPANTNNVVIRLTNTAPGGCGNDIALDDITFRPCGPTVLLTANNNGTDFNLCSNSLTPVTISANIAGGYVSPSFQWQESLNLGLTWQEIAGANSTGYNFNKTAVGVYKYRLAVADGSNISLSSCRVASNAITVTIHGNPVITASANGPVCENTLVNLEATGGTSYQWTGPSGYTGSGANPSFMGVMNAGGQYFVTGTDQFGCTSTSAVNLVVNAKPLATISPDTTICLGDSIFLSAGGGQTFLWSPATDLSSLTVSNPLVKAQLTTTYTVVVTGSNACTDTADVIVNVLARPIANAGGDKMLLKGESAVLDGAVSVNNSSYYWTPGSFLDNANSLTPVATPPTDQVYTLHAESGNGCGSSTDDVFVKVYNDIYIPKAFSPNNDGLNDTWNIEALAVFPNSKMMVYNRFGETVFEGTANTGGWNGLYKNQPLPVGAYTYVMDLKNGRPVIKGTVMIVR